MHDYPNYPLGFKNFRKFCEHNFRNKIDLYKHCGSVDCPIARFIKARYRKSTTVTVTQFDIEIILKNKKWRVYSMPAWAKDFIARYDNYTNEKRNSGSTFIKASTILKILDSIDPKLHNRKR